MEPPPVHSEIVDPVCRMKIDPAKGKLVCIYEGKSYSFCSESCQKAFEADPRKYLMQPPPKKGRFKRWLDRMAKSNQQAFGSSGPKCH